MFILLKLVKGFLSGRAVHTTNLHSTHYCIFGMPPKDKGTLLGLPSATTSGVASYGALGHVPPKLPTGKFFAELNNLF
jgi:hypothetical protein